MTAENPGPDTAALQQVSDFVEMLYRASGDGDPARRSSGFELALTKLRPGRRFPPGPVTLRLLAYVLENLVRSDVAAGNVDRGTSRARDLAVTGLLLGDPALRARGLALSAALEQTTDAGQAAETLSAAAHALSAAGDGESAAACAALAHGDGAAPGSIAALVGPLLDGGPAHGHHEAHAAVPPAFRVPLPFPTVTGLVEEGFLTGDDAADEAVDEAWPDETGGGDADADGDTTPGDADAAGSAGPAPSDDGPGHGAFGDADAPTTVHATPVTGDTLPLGAVGGEAGADRHAGSAGASAPVDWVRHLTTAQEAAAAGDDDTAAAMYSEVIDTWGTARGDGLTEKMYGFAAVDLARLAFESADEDDDREVMDFVARALGELSEPGVRAELALYAAHAAGTGAGRARWTAGMLTASARDWAAVGDVGRSLRCRLEAAKAKAMQRTPQGYAEAHADYSRITDEAWNAREFSIVAEAQLDLAASTRFVQRDPGSAIGIIDRVTSHALFDETDPGLRELAARLRIEKARCMIAGGFRPLRPDDDPRVLLDGAAAIARELGQERLLHDAESMRRGL
ncbi:hypothetical protein [Corynebacterium sp. 335C]